MQGDNEGRGTARVVAAFIIIMLLYTLVGCVQQGPDAPGLR